MSIIVASSGSSPFSAAISDCPAEFTAKATSPRAIIPQPTVRLSFLVNPNGFAASEQPIILPAMPSATNANPNHNAFNEKDEKSALMPMYAKKMGVNIIYPLTTALRSTNGVSSSPEIIIPATYAPVMEAIPKNFSEQYA